MNKKVRCLICGCEYEIEDGKSEACPVCNQTKYEEIVEPEPIPEPVKVDACPNCKATNYDVIAKPVDKEYTAYCDICGAVYSFNEGESDNCPVCNQTKYQYLPTDKYTVRCKECHQIYSYKE